MTMGLADLIAPTSTADFLAKTYHRGPSYFPGPADRFADLFSWDVLNRALSRNRLEFPRLRLVRESEAIAPERYTERVSVGEGRTAARVLASPLMGLVRQGATLIVDSVDEFCDPVQRVAMDLERLLRLQVGACAYLSGTTEPAFDSHIDQVDTFVLQLFGTKRWRIYEPTREAPLLRDVAVEPEPPKRLVIDQVMTPGDVLYFPRGWWHSVETVEPPALHLTFGVASVCGSDLLEWVAEQLLNDPAFRRDVPVLGGEEEQSAYLASLLQTITKVWDRGLLQSFIRYRDLQARARQHFGLPWAATEALLPPGEDFLVHFAAPRASIEVDEGVVRLHADGRRWVFDGSVAGLLDDLITADALPVGELYRRHGDTIDPADVRLLIEDLQSAGLVYWTSPRP